MKINQQKAQSIIDEYIAGTSRKDLEKRYNISEDYVYQIITGKAYPLCKRPADISLSWQRTFNKHKLNSTTAQEIIDLYLSGDNSKSLATCYGVRANSIIGIVRGDNYKDCKRPADIKTIIHNRQYIENKQWIIDKNNSLPAISQRQFDILTGSLLGDGCVKKYITSSDFSNSRFCKTQCVRHKEYLDWHLEELSPYSTKLYKSYTDSKIINHKDRKIEHKKTGKKTLKSFVLGTISHPIFTNLRDKWYIDGKKIIPHDLVLTPLTIAIWYCDDGSNDYKGRKSQICTNGFSFEEVEFLVEKLKDFDLFPKIESRMGYENKQPVLRFYSNSSYDNLINLVKPFVVWDCFQYKIRWWKPMK